MFSLSPKQLYNDAWIVRIIKNEDNLPLSERLLVKREEHDVFEENEWTNRDLIPTPKDRQTWDSMAYLGYWAVAGMGVSTWSTGSSALAYGLNCQESLIAISCAYIFTGALCCFIGVIGQKCRIGFTVSSRASYGFYGCYLPIAIKSFVACIWQGMHFYYMGQGFVGTFGALSPDCITGNLGTTFSDWCPLTKIELIGTFCGIALFAVMMLLPPEKMQKWVYVSFVMQVGSFFGILGWAVNANGGKLGALWTQRVRTTSGDFSPVWACFFVINGICGSSSGILGQSDWTRYANSRFAPNWSQLLSAPITQVVTAAMGIFASAAMEPVLGEIYWNPVTLLPALLKFYDFSPGVRAGVFFASFGIISGQLWQAVLLTACSTGMDVATYSPRYLNIRRGSYIMSIIGILCQPWKILATSNTFLTVISGFSVFVGPMAGIIIGDFYVIRRMKYKMPDLYHNQPPSIYSYKWGTNWRGMVAFWVGFLPMLPGLAMSANGNTLPRVYEKVYNLTYFFGLLLALLVYVICNYISPPPGLGEEEPYVIEHEIIDEAASSASGSELEKNEKVEVNVASV